MTRGNEERFMSTARFVFLVALGASLSAACGGSDSGATGDDDDAPETPTAASVAADCNELLRGHRGDAGATHGYISQLGILGREPYDFTSDDPSPIAALAQQPLAGDSRFGQSFWTEPYANIRLSHDIVRDLDGLAPGELSDAEKRAIRGL